MSYEERPKRDDTIEYKDKFTEHYKELLGADWEVFCRCNEHYLGRAIRVNTLKADVGEIKKRLLDAGWKLKSVPWCKKGFWIDGERLDIGNLLEHQLGYVYIQDPASMLPPIVLGPEPGDRVLDMCASPGSKTSQAAAMMKNRGIIVANDSDGSRIVALGTNLQRLGVMNAVITKRDGRHFKQEFDKVMVDAPCSGIGTIRRSLKSIDMFNMKQIEKMSRLQSQLAQTGFDCLRKGGVMTYSTCTLEPLENEVVVNRLLQENPDAELMDITLDIVREKVFTENPYTNEEFHPDIEKCIRIHPYTNDTEGFFVAKIRKLA